MASSLQLLFLLCLSLISFSHSQTSFKPKALILPVAKDAPTLQYVTTINQRTPLIPIKLVVDLSGHFVWVDCDSGYVSSSYRPTRCHSAQCSAANAHSFCTECNNIPSPGCNNNSCSLSPQNGVTEYITGGDVSQDVVALHSTDGSKPGPIVTIPRFIFSCTADFLVEGLANGAKGIAGLGKTRIALPSQLASTFNFRRKFAICLSPSTVSPGVIFFGDGPYVFLPHIDISKSLTYTKLINNPVSTNGVALRGEPSFEYFIGVSSIEINGKHVLLNSSLLSIGKNGVGGTKFSTVAPYSILETSIYKAFTEAFIIEAKSMKINRVASVAPFETCFSSKNIGSTRGGPAVPTIDLVLQSKNVFWRILGSNSMVKVKDDVMCLGFVDAKSVPEVAMNPKASIVIGGHQLENNLVQIDLASSRVGFSSSLLNLQTTCSNFNFKSNT